VVDGKLQGRDTTLVVQMFGTRLAAVPSITNRPAVVVPAVKAAAELSPLPSPAQVMIQATPFDLTKVVSIALLTVFVVVLVIDLIVVHQRKIVRWTSKSLAHLALLLFLLIAAVLVNRGVIL